MSANDLADALPPVCPTCGSDTPTTYFGSCLDNQHSTIFDPRLPLDPWHAYMAELAHLRRQVDSLNAYVGVGQELLQKAEAKVRVQGERLDTRRAAIGETGDIGWLASACLDEAMACQQIGGFGETVGVLSQAAVAFQRIAAAVPQDPEEGRA